MHCTARPSGDDTPIRRGRRLERALCAVAMLALVAGSGAAPAQDLEQLLAMRTVTALEEVDGHLFAGLDGGGVFISDIATPDRAVDRWTAGDGVTGNVITDLFWSGRHLWVATSGGGVTRVSDPAGAAVPRVYTSNLASLEVTALAGRLVADSERIYYGTAASGFGIITDGVAGSIYTAAQDGLVSDEVRALAVHGDAVFVGTPLGVSRFAANVLTDVSTGLANPDIRCFGVDASGRLLAGGAGGIYRWDDGGEAWTVERASAIPVVNLETMGSTVYALAERVSAPEILLVRESNSWQSVVPPEDDVATLHAGTSLWLGGTVRTFSDAASRDDAYVARMDAGETFATWRYEATLVRNIEGVTFGADGRAWLGDWGGRALSGTDGESWTHVWEAASAANDSSGRFAAGGNVLAMATDADGAVWAGQYAVGGLLRHDPETGITRTVDPDNSGLLGRGIINLVAHPDGPLLVLHDWRDATKVEVLIDPAAWRNTDNWVGVTGGALGDGPSVWDAAVQRRDVIWFAVEGVGLVRWDVNGDAAGPGDALTWRDTSDDRWDAPVTSWPGTTFAPEGAFGLDVAPDGSIWAGGNGLVQFAYDPSDRSVATMTVVGEKFSSTVEGLITANVKDIAVDAAGDVWVATAAGLNRVSGTGFEFEVDAWLDLGNYFANPNYAVLYSPNVIAPLPGTTYRKIVADAEGRKLLLSADQGATLVTVGASGNGGDAGGALARAYTYPSPWVPDGAAGTEGWLKLDGLGEDVRVDVKVYDLNGQLLLSREDVGEGEGFWDGTNSAGRRVASGLYLLHIGRDGETTVKTIAVVR